MPSSSGRGPKVLRLLAKDRVALVAALYLVGVVVVALVGPLFLGDLATTQQLRRTNLPPFSFGEGWAYALGSDSLGRSELARLVVASRTTLSIAVPAVLLSMAIGTVAGLFAGYRGGWYESLAMRIADIILSFPSLLMAVVVLYIFEPRLTNVVAVLVLARIPVYLRTARAETRELRSRPFVDASRTFGTRDWSILRRHVAPIVLPTVLTVATLDFAFVMLTESSLSFLGIGVQPPRVSWGLMVAQGRQYLQTAWWLAVLPGVAIVLTTMAATVLSNWARLATDPAQRWRLELPRRNLKAVSR